MFATLVTSRCDTVLGLCDGATRLQVTDKLCDKCDLHLVSAEYPKVRLVILVTNTGKNPRFVTIVIDCGKAETVVIHLCQPTLFTSVLRTSLPLVLTQPTLAAFLVTRPCTREWWSSMGGLSPRECTRAGAGAEEGGVASREEEADPFSLF